MISITLDTRVLEKISQAHGLTRKEREAVATQLLRFLGKIQSRGQGFYEVIDDVKTTDSIEAFVKKTSGRYDDVVVLGIGGSALGTKCLQQALLPFFEARENVAANIADVARTTKTTNATMPSGSNTTLTAPRLYVLDNIDPSLIRDLEATLNLKKTLFLVVSKSGNTIETLVQYFYFQKRVQNAGLNEADHFVFITDAEKGLLREIANKNLKITTFTAPKNVGGRFSVLTPVSLVPAALMSLDIRQLLSGAQVMRDIFLNLDAGENLCFQLAAIQYLLGQKGKNINVFMPYSSHLVGFTEWVTQLLAESIGKALNEKGERVNVGLTPLRAVGATDQHAQSQLFHEGPNDKLIIFFEIENFGKPLAIPNPYPDHPAVSFLRTAGAPGATFDSLLKTEKRGTEQSLIECDRPNLTIRLDRLDEASLGGLFMLFEGATAFLAEFYGINAFDQPGVERSKRWVREEGFRK